MKPKRLIIAAVAVLLLAIVALVALGFAMTPKSSRPLFANRKQGDPETGRTGWWIDRVILPNGTTAEYDDEENILVVGKRDTPNDLLLMPGRNGALMTAGYKGTTINLPIWKNSAILFDKTGMLRVIFLERTQARDLFNAINKDHSEIERIFEPAGPLVR
jgi:hypothetical protein